MTWLLLRTDVAWRRWAHWGAIAVGSATLWQGALHWALDSGRLADPRLWLPMIWLPAGLYVVAAPLGRRSAPAALSWPLPASRLVWTHLAAVALSALGLLLLTWAVAWGVMVAIPFAESAQGEGLARTRAAMPGMLAQAAIWTLATVAAMQARRPELVEAPRDRRGALLGIVLLAGGLQIMASLGSPVAVVAPALLIGLAAVLHLRRRLPAALVLAPKRLPVAAGGPGTIAGTARGAAAPGPLGRRLLLARVVMVGSGKQTWSWLVALVVMAGFGAFLGDLYPVLMGRDSEGFGLLMYAMVAYILFAFAGAAMSRLGFLDAWPLPRRRVLGLVVWPTVAALLAGFVLGSGAAAVLKGDRELASNPLCGPGGRPCIGREVAAVAWDGHPPPVTAPWGEAHRPAAVPAWSGGPALYDPYAVPEAASERYAAWQGERLTRALAASRPEGPQLAVTLGAALLLFWAALVLYLRTLRPGRGAARRRLAFVAGLALLLGIHLVPFVLTFAGLADLSALMTLLSVETRRIGEAGPAGYLGAWAAAALIAWGGFEAGTRSLRRAELPPPETAGGG